MVTYRIHFKELAHVTVEAGKYKICRAGQRPREELLWSQVQKQSRGRIPSYLGDLSLAVSWCKGWQVGDTEPAVNSKDLQWGP